MPRIRIVASALVAVLATLPPTACDLSDEGGPRIDTAGRAGELPADEDDRYSIRTTDHALKLGLTDEVVYMRFSDRTLREIDREMEEETEDREGLAGAISSAVTGAVSRGLRTRVSFAHENIRDIRWEDRRLVVELENGEHAFSDMEVEDEDVMLKFDESDAHDFVEEWRRVKEAPGGGG